MKPGLVFFILSVGIAVGVVGTIFAPDVAGPLLPEALRSKKAETIDGEVVRKLREGDRLLLTVHTSQGSVLATFKKKVAEIDLLVQQGDTITLALSRYEPFVDEPAIERVRKQEPTPRPKASAPTSSPGVAEWRNGKGEGEKEGIAMSLMCAMQECKQMPGMCKHEKMMLGVLLILIVGVGAYFLSSWEGGAGPFRW
jgi:hypothetical protein